MNKKNKHPSPMEYRIRYKTNGDPEESTQYYNVYHSSEALNSLTHTFKRGHIDGDGEQLKIIAVEEYNRFSLKWEDRTSKAIEYSESAELLPNPNNSDFKAFLTKN